MKVIQQLAAETGFVVMSPDYRRAPQHPFPAPYDDCLKSTLEFIDRAPEFHVNPKQIVLSGDSAGGNLALSITAALVKMNIEGHKAPIPIMQALVYPAVQMIDFRTSSYQHDFGGHPLLSNMLMYKFWLSYSG